MCHCREANVSGQTMSLYFSLLLSLLFTPPPTLSLPRLTLAFTFIILVLALNQSTSPFPSSPRYSCPRLCSLLYFL
ncbi:MAG: hypothetical protein JOS17DRAFT_113493 [Linnemannia elongata]|nr:MAG: hypothetical protein JOS17DRAFT_113493 [Linnemannia elongata]